jgi:hypothetical protein
MNCLSARSVASQVLTGVLLLCAASSAFASEQLRTVVVGLEGRRNVDEGLALAMSDVVHGETLSDKTRVVFGRTDLQRVLEFESEKQALGCQADSCLAELASAMDADRIITGSIDKVGSSYFVVIAEIDAKKVEPVGRVQRTLPLDEDKLIIGIQEMTRELLRSGAARPRVAATKPAASTATAAPVVAETVKDVDASTAAEADEDPSTGSIEITSDPEGLEVFRDGILVGTTPFRFDDLAPGTIAIAVGFEKGTPPLPVDVTVVAGETTAVEAAQSTSDPSPLDMAAYESASSTNTWISWGLIGGGVACCALGIVGGGGIGAVLDMSLGSNIFTPVLFSLGCCSGCVACAGLSIAGLVNMFAFSPDRPRALADEVHRVIIRVPDEDPIVVEEPAHASAAAPESPPPALPDGENVSLLF